MTKLVRIALAIGPDGEWNAVGFPRATDECLMGLASDDIPDARRFWVEVEIEVPDVPVVAAVALPIPKKIAA